MTPLESLGLKLAVPYNFDERLLDFLEPYAPVVSDVFLPAPPDVVGTMRPWSGPDPDEYRRSLPRLAARLRASGLDANLVMNSLYQAFDRFPAIVSLVREALDGGFRYVTVGDLHLAEAIRDACPDAGIIASTTANIDCVTRARHWARQVAPARLVVVRYLNRMPEALAALRRVGIPLEAIVDEVCLPACPYEIQHGFSMGQCGETGGDSARFSDLCWPLKTARPWEHFQNEIVPATVPRLRGLVDVLKLTSRGRPTGFLKREIERYTRLESDRHLVLGYREPPEVFDRLATCDRVCEQCGFCERVFREANPDFDPDHVRRLGDLGREEPSRETRPAPEPDPGEVEFGPVRQLAGFDPDPAACTARALGLAGAATAAALIVEAGGRFILCRTRAPVTEERLRAVRQGGALGLEAEGRAVPLARAAGCLGCPDRDACVGLFVSAVPADGFPGADRLVGRVVDLGGGLARPPFDAVLSAALRTDRLEYHAVTDDPEARDRVRSLALPVRVHGGGAAGLAGLGPFDAAFAVGSPDVTRDPEAAARALAACVRPGAPVVVAGRAPRLVVRLRKGAGDASTLADDAWDARRMAGVLAQAGLVPDDPQPSCPGARWWVVARRG